MEKLLTLTTLLYFTHAFHKNSHGNFPKIKVLESTLDLTMEGTAISGAHLINSAPVEGVKDVTFCIRFNYQILGDWEGVSQLIHIEDWRNDSMVQLSQALIIRTTGIETSILTFLAYSK